MSWIVRRATPDDAEGLSRLAERTFRDAFSDHNTAENMDLHCAGSFSPTLQAAEIENPEIHTVVAESGDGLVAFAQVHLRAVPPDCLAVCRSVELHRIYVERDHQGSGVANDLMDSVLRTAARYGAEAVWLGVWEHNPRAIRFYRRFGFTVVGEQVFVVGADPQRDLVMSRDLTT